jgi:hypothetical protein
VEHLEGQRAGAKVGVDRFIEGFARETSQWGPGEVIDLSLSLLDALSHVDRTDRVAAGVYGGPMDLKIVPALVLVEPLGDLADLGPLEFQSGQGAGVRSFGDKDRRGPEGLFGSDVRREHG